MAKRAKGKKSYAISDISGFKVPYKQLKTTWDNLRVEPEEFEHKHPQLTPVKNIFFSNGLSTIFNTKKAPACAMASKMSTPGITGWFGK